MCGISGILNYNKNIIDEKNIIADMTTKLNHRGPDAMDFYVHNHILLGHARLIVVDPIGGYQPMTINYHGRLFTIVYNGELYNTEDVRSDLIDMGHHFDSYSDTEVLLRAYIEWREDCVHHLNGIFGFAVWDGECETLFLARDRAGVKPLFYSNKDGYFIFASEMKSLLASKIIEPIINEEGLLQMFSLGPSRPFGKTVYKDILELKPGEYMIVTKSQHFKKIYWDLKTKDHTENINTTTEHIRYLMTDAIEKQLVSDVPLCTFLSGGLDSSLISSVASRYLHQHNRDALHTYCIDYKENDLYYKKNAYQPTRDTDYALKVSEYLKTKHHKIEVGIDELVETLWDATYAMDYPGMADIDTSLMLFCKEVKKNFTVALSGECADEIFGGYPWYRNKEDVNEDFFPWIKHMDLRENILSENLNKLDLKGYAKNAWDETVKKVDYLENEDKFNKNIRRLTYVNHKWFMLTLLNRKDRMSMYNSLEVRVPFADHRIMEYAYNIPWTYKYLENYEKGLLRKAMEGYLPHEILYRKKSPYPKTYHPNYLKSLGIILEDILSDKNALINQLINKKFMEKMLYDKRPMDKPMFGQLMKRPQFIAYFIQLHYFLEMNDVIIREV